MSYLRSTCAEQFSAFPPHSSSCVLRAVSHRPNLHPNHHPSHSFHPRSTLCWAMMFSDSSRYCFRLSSHFGWGLRIRPAMDEDPQVTINMKVLRWRRIWLRAKQVRFLIALGGHLLQYPIPSLPSSLYHLIAFPFFYFTLSPFLFFGTPSRSRPRSKLASKRP